MPRQKPRTKPLIGWREWVTLPALSPIPIKAKIDTGALTSSLHAFDLKTFEDEEGSWVDFEIHPLQRSRASASRVTSPLHGYRRVRSSTGHSERRPVIKTIIKIGNVGFPIDITLTSRDEMGFRMLLGRSALRRRFWVDAGRSFLHPAPDASPHPARKDHK